jgi:hypothetical protein
MKPHPNLVLASLLLAGAAPWAAIAVYIFAI